MTAPDSPSGIPFIHRHPWIILMVIFAVLVGAWTTMIIIASRNRSEKVPLEHLDDIPRSTPGAPADTTPSSDA